jgi:drug/metabolite transporter (DMT)-like permease
MSHPQLAARQQSNLLGIAFMAAAIALYAGADTIAKYLGQSYHPIQVTGMRQMGLVVGVALWLMLRGTKDLRTARPGLQILRGVCATFSGALYVYALSYIPLADAATVSFAAPFFVTILGYLILKEPVGLRRWSAIFVGFLGTLVVIRPGFDSFHPAYFLVLMSALLFALRQIISRNLGATESTVTTVAFTAVVSAGLLGVAQPFVWQPIAAEHIALFVLYAALAGVGEFMVIRSLEVALAVVVAPLQYTMILWTTLYGFVIFGDLPDGFTLAGGAIIILAGGFTFWREYQLKAKAAKLQA